MRRAIMREPRQRWLMTGALIMGILCLSVGTGLAEEDHLTGYKIKDLNKVAPPANPYALTNEFGTETCDLKKPQFFLKQGEKNGGDDARGGPAGDFVCYKAKCSNVSVPPVATDVESQFGVHALESRSVKLVCLPVNPAGNPCPAGGGDDTACNAVFATSECASCYSALSDFTCITAFAANCLNAQLNDDCAAAVNAGGCASVCCP